MSKKNQRIMMIWQYGPVAIANLFLNVNVDLAASGRL